MRIGTGTFRGTKHITMSVSSLLNVPRGIEEFNRWTFNHAQDHLKIIQVLKSQLGADLVQYQLDPVPFDNPFEFLRRHAQTHIDMNGVLGLQSIDLSETDFNDPNRFSAWVYSNYQEHNNVHLKLGI